MILITNLLETNSEWKQSHPSGTYIRALSKVQLKVKRDANKLKKGKCKAVAEVADDGGEEEGE